MPARLDKSRTTDRWLEESWIHRGAGLGKEPSGNDPEPGDLPVGDQRPSSRLRGRCQASSRSASSCPFTALEDTMKRHLAALAAAALAALASALPASAFTPQSSAASHALEWLHTLQSADGTVAGSASRTEDTVLGLVANRQAVTGFATAGKTPVDSLRAHIADEEKTAGNIGGLIRSRLPDSRPPNSPDATCYKISPAPTIRPVARTTANCSMTRLPSWPFLLSPLPPRPSPSSAIVSCPTVAGSSAQRGAPIPTPRPSSSSPWRRQTA